MFESDSTPAAVCVFFEEIDVDEEEGGSVRVPWDIDSAFAHGAQLCLFRLGETPQWHKLPRTSKSDWLTAFVGHVAAKHRLGDTVYSPHFNAVLGAALNIQALKSGTAPVEGRLSAVDMVAAFYGPTVLTLYRRTSFSFSTAAAWLNYTPTGVTQPFKKWSLIQQSQFMTALTQALHSQSFEVPRV